LGDVLQNRGEKDGSMLIVASRLLDVEAFVNNQDETFSWQKTTTTCGQGVDFVYDEERWRTLFEDIIKSYQEKGYNGTSHFLLDRNRMLRNGTHRTALHLFYKIYTAKAYAVNRRYPIFDESYERFRHNLQPRAFETLETKLEQIRQQLISDGVSFCALIPEEASLDSILPLISSFIHVKKVLGLGKLPVHLIESLKLNSAIVYKLVQFTLEGPQYEVVSGLLKSQKIIQSSIPKYNYVSNSCYEGKQIYDALHPYFINE
jgi:hypothetical protein